jgi:hypothetical protein
MGNEVSHAWPKSLAGLVAYLEGDDLPRFESELTVLVAVLVHHDAITVPELERRAGFPLCEQHIRALFDHGIVTPVPPDVLHTCPVPDRDNYAVNPWAGPRPREKKSQRVTDYDVDAVPMGSHHGGSWSRRARNG